LMDEPYLVETIKDALCFVSQDVRSDLQVFISISNLVDSFS